MRSYWLNNNNNKKNKKLKKQNKKNKKQKKQNQKKQKTNGKPLHHRSMQLTHVKEMK